MHPTIAWILVADGQQARTFEATGPGKGLRELAESAITQVAPPTREQGTDRPGRVAESVGSARHAMEPRVDWHREAKVAFARMLARRLETALGEHRCHRLVLIAPPRTLGDLREALSDDARRCVVGEIAKDLVKATPGEIEAQVGLVVAI